MQARYKHMQAKCKLMQANASKCKQMQANASNKLAFACMLLAFACICLYLLVFVCICLHLLVFACLHCGFTTMFTLLSYSQLNSAFPSTYLLQRSSRRIKRQQWQVCIGPKPPKKSHHVEADSYVHSMFSASTPFANKTTKHKHCI